MRIAIDTQTTLGQKTGFGFYVKNLVENLKKVDPPSGMQDDYILIKPQTGAGLSPKDFSTPQRLFWDQATFPKQSARAKVDLLHQPCFSAPLFYRGKVVVTVHDLISMHFPQNLPFFSRMFYSKWMPFTYKRADKIIAISYDTKKDIVERLGIAPEKIQVIHSAVSPDFKPIKDKKILERVKHKYHTGEHFILDVGTLEPRKNLPFLVRAFNLAIEKENIPHNLVLSGKKGWYYEGLFTLIKELKLQDRVIFAGYVPEEDLPALYSAADLFAYPSLYEGFGFPPLEAMACGTPVVCSNTSSLPEVVGDAGISLPPENEARWVKEIVRVLKDKNLGKALSRRGIKQAKKFSWEKTAQETIEVYKEVLDED